jgi:WD40 repeat protein/tRNA A-37 threonylcarbamoyl transferase component Bud32
MSPSERARRALTPPPPGSGERRAAVAGETPAVPLTPPLGAPPGDQADVAGLPVDDSARYEMAGVHARGGLGRVVKARDRRLHRTVAIKELLQRTPSAEARFVREALIAARLEHPGIVPVHEAGRWPSGEPYYSMKLVSGRTLKELIQERPQLDDRLALVPHVLAVAEALAYAHSQRVIHRDLKPANVIIGDFGETVVVDWGLAKDLSIDAPDALEDAAGEQATASGSGSDGTGTGNVMGTPSYMSPEQARGDEVDTRADVYSLGAMLYELLAGEPPHTGSSPAAILDSALAGNPRTIEERQPGAPLDLCAILRVAMARDPDARYPSAVELAEDLRRFQTGQLVTARHYSTRTLVRRWIGRHLSLVAVVAAAALALVATGAFAFQRVVGERNRARSERALAQRAERKAERRSQELTFLQAQSSLPGDPTAAAAWLKDYPPDGPHADRLSGLLDEAIASGVARHVLRHRTWVMGVAYAGPGRALSIDMEGGIHLWDLASGEGQEVARHKDGVMIAVPSPGGELIALGGYGGGVGLFAPDDPGAIRTLSGGPGYMESMDFSRDKSMDFSRDGSRLLSWGMGSVRVWGTAGGEVLLALDEEKATAAALAPDGKSALVSFHAGELVEIRIGSGTRRTVARLGSGSHRVVISPSGRHAFSSGMDDVNRLVELDSGKVRVVGTQPAKVGWAEFSPAGDLVAAAGGDGTVRLYRVAGGEEKVLRGHSDSIYQVSFARDGGSLVTASDDGTARVWDLETGESRVLRGHSDDVYRVALSGDSGELLTASLDRSMRVWPLESVPGRALAGGPPGIWGLRFADGDRSLTAYTADGQFAQCGLEDGEWTVQQLAEPDQIERAVHGGGMDLGAIGLKDGRLQLISRRARTRSELPGRRGPLVAMAMSHDNRWLVTGNRDGLVEVWDLRASDRPSPRVLFQNRPVFAAGLSQSGDRLVLGERGRLAVIDRESGQELASTDLAAAGLPSYVPADLSLSPDGRFVASRSKTARSLLWNVETGEVRPLEPANYLLTWFEFSPDSKHLAVSVSDRTIRLIDSESGREQILTGHSDMVMRVAFSPDSATLASASYDRTVRLWNVASGRTTHVLRGHNASVDAIAFSLSGTLLASAARDGVIRLWNLPALPPTDPASVARRLAEITTAVIAAGEPSSPTSLAR